MRHSALNAANVREKLPPKQMENEIYSDGIFSEGQEGGFQRKIAFQGLHRAKMEKQVRRKNVIIQGSSGLATRNGVSILISHLLHLFLFRLQFIRNP